MVIRSEIEGVKNGIIDLANTLMNVIFCAVGIVVALKLIVYSLFYSSYQTLCMTWLYFSDKYMRRIILNSDYLVDKI
jgi:hypothetical protein